MPAQLNQAWNSSLKWVDITFIDADKSGQIHQEFFQDPEPTDVMTFPSGDGGDILICPEVANQQRNIEDLSLHDEIRIYIIHGMLHLCGYDDLTNEGFETMRQLQMQIFKKSH